MRDFKYIAKPRQIKTKITYSSSEKILRYSTGRIEVFDIKTDKLIGVY